MLRSSVFRCVLGRVVPKELRMGAELCIEFSPKIHLEMAMSIGLSDYHSIFFGYFTDLHSFVAQVTVDFMSL